ncbi:MAG TPA: hypothetical protein VFE42_27310 [Chloroflexota bacterium]|nr:hypothetical protein [Chloroflexota bacterium]
MSLVPRDSAVTEVRRHLGTLAVGATALSAAAVGAATLAGWLGGSMSNKKKSAAVEARKEPEPTGTTTVRRTQVSIVVEEYLSVEYPRSNNGRGSSR